MKFFRNGDGRLLDDLRAPGIERKNSASTLFADSFQPFGVDYEQKKLMANKGSCYRGLMKKYSKIKLMKFIQMVAMTVTCYLSKLKCF